MESAKVKVAHPVLNLYQPIHLRHRFVRGFSPKGRELLRKFWCHMARQNIAHYKFPVSVGIMTDGALLTSAAFDRQGDKEAVPAWRDGKAGHELQDMFGFPACPKCRCSIAIVGGGQSLHAM